MEILIIALFIARCVTLRVNINIILQINLLQVENQLVIEIPDLDAEAMRRMSRALLGSVEERSGLVAGLQKLTERHYRAENGTLQSDRRGSEAWLYLLDPATGEILTRDSDLVKK